LSVCQIASPRSTRHRAGFNPTSVVTCTRSLICASQQTSSIPVYCSVPQGPVLGPLEFIAYTEDITDITDLLNRSDIRSHLCADDTQHVSCRPEDMATDCGEEYIELYSRCSCLVCIVMSAAKFQQDRGHLVLITGQVQWS